VTIPEYVRVEGLSRSVTVDVMLLYSRAAVARGLHGSALTTTMDEVNRIFRDTGITFRVVGVYSMKEDSVVAQTAARVESGEAQRGELLRTVSADEAIRLTRIAVGADIVLTWTAHWRDDGWVSGTAWRPGSRGAFSSRTGYAQIHTNTDQGAGGIAAHELGHNLGLHHPPGSQRDGYPYVSHGQGYTGSHTDLDRPYYTVMGTAAEVDEDHYRVPELSAQGFTDYYGRRIRIGDSQHRSRDAAAYTASWVADYVPTVKGPEAPDLVVESPRSTETSVAPRGAFRFAATVRNSGDSRSDATTLRYYRSSDSRISTSDTPIGSDPVGALPASGTDRQNIGQRAPETPGTYYYGACVDSVSGEADTTNNCSSGVPISVVGGTSGCSGDTCLLQGARFKVKAWYSRDGSPNQKAGAVGASLGGFAGLFTSDSSSPELAVKVVNNCRTTGGHWEVYAGVASESDFSVAIRHVETNELKWFRARDGRSIADTQAFACTDGDRRIGPETAPPGDTISAPCRGVTCLLQKDRFRVKSWYRTFGVSNGVAEAVSVNLPESAGLFLHYWGGGREYHGGVLLVRIADTCSTSGYWTVYAGAASDADFSVAVRDTETSELKWFRARDGQSVADAEAFACSSGPPPAAPGNLAGQALSATAVRLTWTDRSDNETGFEVNLRAEGESGWIGMHRTPANATSLSLHWTIPPAERRWHFRVRAFNDHGGAYSNIVAVTLPEP
jgi:hypothetical protein